MAQQPTSKPSGGQQQQQQTQQQQTQQQTPQPSGGGDSEAEIAARREAFLNNMEEVFQEHGYGTGGADHEWTQEEKEAAMREILVEGG